MPVSAEHRCHNELLILEPQVSGACSCECLMENPLPCLYLFWMFAGHQLHIKKRSLYLWSMGLYCSDQNAEHVRPNIFIYICLGIVDPGLA